MSGMHAQYQSGPGGTAGLRLPAPPAGALHRLGLSIRPGLCAHAVLAPLPRPVRQPRQVQPSSLQIRGICRPVGRPARSRQREGMA